MLPGTGLTGQLPRTLIVSEAPFSHTNGFGVTLSNLFEGWPADRLRLFYTGADVSSPERKCPTTYADIPGHWGRRYSVPYLLGLRPTWRGRYSALWLRSALHGWKPDLVYAFVISAQTLAFATWIADRVKRPLVAHVADDALESARVGVADDTGTLLRRADARIAISEEMRDEYRTRYGVESDVLHNGAPDALFRRSALPAEHASPFIVRYLGSVVPSHHYDAIEDVGQAVRQMAADGHAVRFEICGSSWTGHHAAPLADGETVLYRGEVSRGEGYELLRTADLLVVPVTFAPGNFERVRFSLPTKLTEYLASGTPTLVYGAAASAPAAFCRRHGVGSVIDDRSVERLVTFISTMAANRTRARRAAEADQNFIRKYYSADVTRERFRRILVTATQSQAIG
jgi:glycosyltransferase involved in cell wall biosynthesis